ncbi:MAG TPA: P-loop NTPase [Polyangiaceae bacterium]|nr:P-loop NTPase [Polyangiaceae bacterium]
MIVVTGAVGGLGASTLAALLAAELARDGASVGLVDLDHVNGGIDVLLGAEGRPGARWSELAEVGGRVEAADLDGVLPSWLGVEVLSAGRRQVDPDAGAVAGVLGALLARHRHVVVDLPAHGLHAAAGLLGPGGTGGVGGIPAPACSVLLTGQDIRGVAGALAIRGALLGGPAGLVLRARRDAVVAPDEAVQLLGLPLLGTLRDDAGVAGAVDRGLGPVPRRRSALARTVRRLAAEVSARG